MMKFDCDSLKNNKYALICLLLGALTLVLYWPVGGHDFVTYDDPLYITRNAHVQQGISWAGVVWAFQTFDASNWHPLTWISHMLDYSLFGMNPAGPHFTNLFLHIANVLLVFALFNRMTGALWRSALVAALFAWHPLHVESVAWISERKDMLSTFFWMLATMAYIRYATRPGLPAYCATLILFALGLMCKPMLVTLPCVFLLLDFWPLGRFQLSRDPVKSISQTPAIPLRRLLAEKIPFLALALGSSLLTVLAQKSGGAVSSLEAIPFSSRVANAFVSYFRYVTKTFWPSDLSCIYPYSTNLPPGLVILSCIFVLGVTFLVIWRLRQNPYLAVGWFWFLGTLTPTIGILQVGLQSMADRYMYIPSLGLFMVIAWGLHDLWQWRPAAQKALMALEIGALTGFFICASLQLRYWQNTETLFLHANSVTRNNFVAYDSLAVYYTDHQRVPEAVSAYEHSVRIEPRDPETQYNLGSLLLGQGKIQEAIAHLKIACARKPGYPAAHNNLGKALLAQGLVDSAVDEIKKAIELAPKDPSAFYNLGTLYLKQSKLKDALSAFSEALRLKPDYTEAQGNAGVAYMMQGNAPEGIRHLAKAVELEPENVQWHVNLGRALLNSGNARDAEKQFLEGLRLSPSNTGIAQLAHEAHEKSPALK